MSEERTLAQIVADYEPAADVTDLDTARRLITRLRQDFARLAEEHNAGPAEGEHTVFLDADHERILNLLYDRKKLAYQQENDAYNEEYEFDEVFTDFVQGYLDVAWDMAKDEERGMGKPVKSA